ncbi:hypothetical protein K2173_019083 [Erythroxylum novogranatense]|uniref:Peptidoglycan binding-like domain-containing protein n=1 Tax=Erythroxylum novogranatense TaxID=1862640 RepID=A0AAV8STC0_9ROSI|nr:hypothetical protein K2173_019083 [Erythroxylum novogranatense]
MIMNVILSAHSISSNSPMSSSFSLPLYSSSFLLPNKSLNSFSSLQLSTTSTSLLSLSFSTSQVCFSSSPYNDASSSDRQEFLWLREEQRWLREEQRWLREEQRWLLERDSLLAEIQSLKLRIQALESRVSVQGGDQNPNVGTLLQVLKERNLITESGSSSSPIVEEEEKEANEVIDVLKKKKKKEEEEGEKKVKDTKRNTLRRGSEGEEVRAMQEALLVLGFYSGEEDIEYSNFSNGTDRAVKTWQSTLGTSEDGIMTAELLERLFLEQQMKTTGPKISENVTDPQKESANGTAVSSVKEISEIRQKVVKEDGISETGVSQHRVFLIGENRWEQPSRLVNRDKTPGGNKASPSTAKCLTCRGEGRLMCVGTYIPMVSLCLHIEGLYNKKTCQSEFHGTPTNRHVRSNGGIKRICYSN